MGAGAIDTREVQEWPRFHTFYLGWRADEELAGIKNKAQSKTLRIRHRTKSEEVSQLQMAKTEGKA